LSYCGSCAIRSLESGGGLTRVLLVLLCERIPTGIQEADDRKAGWLSAPAQDSASSLGEPERGHQAVGHHVPLLVLRNAVEHS